MSTPIEAQECANCYYHREENLLCNYGYAVPKSLVWCHYHAPQTGTDGTRSATPVRRSAWCGQWKLHPDQGGSINGDDPLAVRV